MDKDLVKRVPDDYLLSRSEHEDVDTVSKRLRWLVDLLGEEAGRKAASLLGLGQATMNTAMRTGRMSQDTFERLNAVTDVNLHWLLTGEGAPGPVRWPSSVADGARLLTRRGLPPMAKASRRSPTSSPPKKRS